jgi:hypothetical protein
MGQRPSMGSASPLHDIKEDWELLPICPEVESFVVLGHVVGAQDQRCVVRTGGGQ